MVQRVLNIVGWIGTALVVAAVAMRLLAPQYDRYAIYMAWAGLVCVLLYPIGQWRQIAKSFNRRQSKYATVATTSVIIALGILVAVNYLSNRRFKRWDLTANSVNTLSDQSLRVLGDLKAPLKLVVIDLAGNLDRHRERMAMYDNASTQVSVEFFDPEKDPVRAKSYDITAVPTIAVEYMGRTEKVSTVEEREITSAIIRAVTGMARKLYFVQGHGERSPTGSDTGGYQFVTQLLKGDNITVETLGLTQHKDVPDDATAVAIVGPTTDLLDEEVEELKRYLAKGGKLLLMLEPAVGERAQPLTKIVALAKEWGVDVGNDLVIDVSGRTQNASYVVALPPYPNNPVTQGFTVGSIYPTARSVTPEAKAPEGKTVQPLVQTAADAWAETDLAGLLAQKQPELNADKGDKAGPVTIAATVSATVAKAPEQTPEQKKEGTDAPSAPQTRLAVFGDADFASNGVANNLGNADLFLNTVSWLTAQENLISIRARERSDSRLVITPTQLDAVWWVAILGVPAVIAVAGIFTWMRRRRS
jgi:gliding motility-associatede transport system auxiliary component